MPSLVLVTVASAFEAFRRLELPTDVAYAILNPQ
jgi:hypothetical protein